MQVAQPLCLAARWDDEAWQWHERFRHLHFEALKRLSAIGMVRGLLSHDHVEQFCDVCVLMKQRRLPFPQQPSFRAKERLELMHGDLCGPVTPGTPGGRRYFLLLDDDLSLYMWVVVLGSKGEAANAIRHAQAAVEAECDRKLRVLRTGNGGESRRLNSHHTARMRMFSATTPRRIACSRTASSSGTTRWLWGWLGPSSSRGECLLSFGERRW
jgi:hypothetical protein